MKKLLLIVALFSMVGVANAGSTPMNVIHPVENDGYILAEKVLGMELKPLFCPYRTSFDSGKCEKKVFSDYVGAVKSPVTAQELLDSTFGKNKAIKVGVAPYGYSGSVVIFYKAAE